MPRYERALIDTSCVIRPVRELDDWAATSAVSTITVAELAFGLHVSDPVEAALREVRYRELLQRYTPVPFTKEAAHLYGGIAAAVARSGRNPRARTADLQIAATAATLNAVLLTRNPDDFIGIDTYVTVVSV